MIPFCRGPYSILGDLFPFWGVLCWIVFFRFERFRGPYFPLMLFFISPLHLSVMKESCTILTSPQLGTNGISQIIHAHKMCDFQHWICSPILDIKIWFLLLLVKIIFLQIIINNFCNIQFLDLKKGLYLDETHMRGSTINPVFISEYFASRVRKGKSAGVFWCYFGVYSVLFWC